MNQRFVLYGCGVVVGIAALAAVFRLAPTASTDSVVQRQAIDSNGAPPYPPAMGGPDLVQPTAATPSEVRRRIVDSPDFYAVISKITPHSPTADKLAAAEVLTACADLRPKARREPVEQVAADELVARCLGIRQKMRRDGALERAIELRVSAEGDASLLGRLAALAQRSSSGARWYGGDIALVSEALRSGDSVLVREAIRALQAQFEVGLPDSSMRARAFAVGAELYLHDKPGDRTEFDALIDCASAGRCGNSGTAAAEEMLGTMDAHRQKEFKRLAEQYRLALQRGVFSGPELLAIR